MLLWAAGWAEQGASALCLLLAPYPILKAVLALASTGCRLPNHPILTAALAPAFAFLLLQHTTFQAPSILPPALPQYTHIQPVLALVSPPPLFPRST